MNVVVPGSGLIWLGRPWLGLSLATWFALSMEAGLCGALIAPAAIPRPVTWISFGLAVLAWAVGMGVLVLRIRLLRNPNLRLELQRMREHAMRTLEAGDPRTAQSVLRIALSLDDGHLETQILWARVLTELGKRSPARRAWKGAARLDQDRRYAREIAEALEQLGAA